MFGLQRIPDAAITVDASIDAPIDAPRCFQRMFEGADIDLTTWVVTMQRPTISFSQNNSLLMHYQMDMTGGATVSSIATTMPIDIADGDVIGGQLTMKPTVSGAVTRLELRAFPSGPVFSIQVARNMTNQIVRQVFAAGQMFHVDFDPVDTYMRLRFEGNEVVFETSSDGGMYMFRKRTSVQGPARATVAFVGAVDGSVLGTGMAQWAKVSTCP